MVAIHNDFCDYLMLIPALTLLNINSGLGSTPWYIFFPLLLYFLFVICLMHFCILLLSIVN